jgi:hypothetical protein
MSALRYTKHLDETDWVDDQMDEGHVRRESPPEPNSAFHFGCRPHGVDGHRPGSASLKIVLAIGESE